MTHLLNSWKESLGIFKSRHLKLIGLVILKRIQETYIHLALYFWWLLGLSILTLFVCSYQFPSIMPHVSAKVLTVWLLIIMLWVRPSIKRPTYEYLVSYSRFVLVLGLVKAIFYWLAYFIERLNYPVLNIFMNSVSFLLIPAALFTVFFYYESDASVTSLGLSIVRSLYLYMYNAPVCLLALPFFGLVWYLHGLVLHSVISSVMVMVLIPIPIIIFAVLYTKQLHEQFEFYYFLKNSNDNKENV